MIYKWEPQIVTFGLAEFDQILWFNLTAKFPGLLKSGLSLHEEGFSYTKGRKCETKSKNQKFQVHNAWKSLNAWKKLSCFNADNFKFSQCR